MAVYWRRGQQAHVIPLCAHCGSGGVSEVCRLVTMPTSFVALIVDALSNMLYTLSLVLPEGLLS